ncbi:hypothetical protein GCAAIG_05840 [Candidatus Electronema halotolerans]
MLLNIFTTVCGSWKNMQSNAVFLSLFILFSQHLMKVSGLFWFNVIGKVA